MSSTIPAADALAANWPADILQAYLEGVEKDRQLCEEDEAMSTDEEEGGVEDSSTSSDISMVDDFEQQPADDIHSNDSAFSSDDEYSTDNARNEQRMRRELVLGRPPLAVLQARRKELLGMKEGYLKQIADADEELAELMVATTGEGEAAVLEELMRSSSMMEVFDRQACVKQLVKLAQVLFRKEREVKRLHRERGNYMVPRGDENGESDSEVEVKV